MIACMKRLVFLLVYEASDYPQSVSEAENRVANYQRLAGRFNRLNILIDVVDVIFGLLQG